MASIGIVCESLGRRCGIAEYTKHLAKAMGADIANTPEALPGDRYEAVLIEHEFGFYRTLRAYNKVVEAARQKAPVVAIDLHTVPNIPRYEPWIAQQADAVFVKNKPMASVLSPYGKVVHIPHFVHDIPVTRRAPPSEVTLGTFGFAFGNKGMRDIIDTANRLGVRALVMASHNDASKVTNDMSSQETERLKAIEQTDKVDVRMKPFFTEQEIVDGLQDCTHVIFPRKISPHTYFASGAAHLAVLAERPLLVGNLQMVEDLDPVYVVRDLNALTLERLQRMDKPPRNEYPLSRVANMYRESLLA